MVRTKVENAIAAAQRQVSDEDASELLHVMELETETLPCEYDPGDAAAGDQDE